MKRFLYLIHRWAGIAVALFMFVWFVSGFVIMYAGSSALNVSEQLAGAETLKAEAGLLSVGDAWRISAAARATLPVQKGRNEPEAKAGFNGDYIASARLMRQAHQPVWLVENGAAQRFALSALTGELRLTSVADAALIAENWIKKTSAVDAVSTPIKHLDTGPQDTSVRNYAALRPFHRFAVGESGRELLISERTGEVVRDSTPFARALYLTGNWIHLLRPIESFGSEHARRNVQLWSGFIAFGASLTGIIIGFQRWRPGWFGGSTYSKGRVHPYRDVWNTWHFWVGLIGGFAALLWAFSGYLSTNPLQLFSPANPSREQLSAYQGKQPPATLLEWQPSSTLIHAEQTHAEKDIVEIQWRYLGEKAAVYALSREGEAIAQNVDGAAARFDETDLLQAAERAFKTGTVIRYSLLNEYDNYYYRRHEQSLLDRPLPILRVEFSDSAKTNLYLDPQSGRLLSKQDSSRRVYRWLYSALHHWDFGWLQLRPLWDAWMLPLVGMGIVLGGTSVVLGWKRLQVEFKPKKKKRAKTAPGTSTGTGVAPAKVAQVREPISPAG